VKKFHNTRGDVGQIQSLSRRRQLVPPKRLYCLIILHGVRSLKTHLSGFTHIENLEICNVSHVTGTMWAITRTGFVVTWVLSQFLVYVPIIAIYLIVAVCSPYPVLHLTSMKIIYKNKIHRDVRRQNNLLVCLLIS